MALRIPLFLHHHLLPLILLLSYTTLPALSTESCKNKCGSFEIKYPLGTSHGCGSPRFSPYVSCSSDGNQLLLATHTGSYPITSISYPTSTLTITPPQMSTCNSMEVSPNFGLDWSGPFQLGSSAIILLSCPAPTSSLTINGIPICDSTYSHLCASLYTCPAITSLGLSLFAPINTCCVYSPANLNTKGDLDLKSLKCATYASVVSLGDVPTDPNRWEYGMKLVFNQAGLDDNNVINSCRACEKSNGICGYAPPRNNFVCVCQNGVNSSTDCYTQSLPYWSADSAAGRILNHHCYVYLLWVFYFSFVLFLALPCK